MWTYRVNPDAKKRIVIQGNTRQAAAKQTGMGIGDTNGRDNEREAIPEWGNQGGLREEVGFDLRFSCWWGDMLNSFETMQEQLGGQ